MGVNIAHLKNLQGILKLVGILVVLCAAAIGTSAFVNSGYNKTCRNNDPLPPEISTEGTDDPFKTEPVSTTTTLRWRTTPPSLLLIRNETKAGQNETIQTLTELETTTEEDGEKDMAPILWMERFHLSVCYIALIVSLVLLVLFVVLDNLEFSKIFKAINFGFHFVWSILLVVAAIFMGYAALEIDRQICQVRMYENNGDCQKYLLKMVSAALSLVAGVLYGVISFLVVSTKLYEEV